MIFRSRTTKDPPSVIEQKANKRSEGSLISLMRTSVMSIVFVMPLETCFQAVPPALFHSPQKELPSINPQQAHGVAECSSGGRVSSPNPHCEHAGPTVAIEAGRDPAGFRG